ACASFSKARAKMALTAKACSYHYRIKGAHGSELRFPRFVTIGRLAHRSGEHTFFRDDDEQRQVNGINAFAQNPALPAPLTVRSEEAHRVLEMIGIHRAT